MLNRQPPPVLIVSRDAELCRRLARAFEPACTPYPAPSRAAALAWLDTNTPRGVVIDLDTPAGERIDLLREVRRRHPTVPCLALATSLTPDLVDDVENLGAEVGSTGSAKIAVSRFAREVAVLLHTRDDRVARCVSALAQARGLTLRQTEILTLAVERVSRDGI